MFFPSISTFSDKKEMENYKKIKQQEYTIRIKLNTKITANISQS